jgi:hypothetical protein
MNNRETLRDAALMQNDSIAVAQRIQNQLFETEFVACTTMNRLDEQTAQLKVIESETLEVNAKLNKSKKLLNKFGRWSLNMGRQGSGQAKKDGQRKVKHIEVETTRKLAGKPKPSQVSPGLSRKQTSRPNKLFTQERSGNQHEQEALDDECRSQLRELEQGDRELDSALDEIGGALDRLLLTAGKMGESVQQQGAIIDQTTSQMDKAFVRSAVVNHRMKQMM